MKFKLSITINEDTIEKIQNRISGSKIYRNKSHFFEVAANELIHKGK